MITIPGTSRRFCDGISRRNFLRIGALGFGGLALPNILQAEQEQGIGRSQKSIIMIYLPGGPPHQDMFEIKTEAPSEIRGEFQPIRTNVPGIEICELLPKMASIMDKLIPVRSVVGAVDDHSNHQCFTGKLRRTPPPPGGWPTFGAVISKLQGMTQPGVPPFVGLEPRMKHRPYNAATPGFLGIGHRSFRPEGDCRADMTLNGITLDRLRDREKLLAGLDRFRRDVDGEGLMEGLDTFERQALGMLASSRLAEALDFQKEDARTLASYGEGDPAVRGDAAPRILEQFLVARRLVEAGVRCVTIAFGFWDYHGDNFSRCREDLPMLDQGVRALVTDLYQRGLDKDVSIIVWGEFGRTPKINPKAGRDHWPRVSCALLSGGGMKTGQAIGATDRLGGEVEERPVHFQEILATLYHNVGLDVNKATVKDLAGRPHYLTDGRQPIPELI